MANKVGMLLSLLLFAQAMLFCGDLIGYQLAITKVTSGSVYIVRKIEEEKAITKEIENQAQENLNVTISCAELDCAISESGMLRIKISTTYTPLLLWLWNLGTPNIVIYRTVYVK